MYVRVSEDKRVRSLKAWTELRLLDIENHFVTCCIIHNILLEHDGFLNADYSPNVHVAPIGVRGDGMWVGHAQGQAGSGAAEDVEVSVSNEFDWQKRIEALALHYECFWQNAQPTSR